MAIQHKTILSLPEIKIKGEFHTPITGVSIDTRSLNAGELFVAFNGAQVDGHDFIQQAISRGTSAVMASTFWDGCEHWDAPIPLIMTPDPVKTLADLAKAHRNRFEIPVIAITGTNGKTSTKNLLTHILSQHYKVLSTDGNFNNHIGLPITILNLDESHEFAVIEMGASRKNDIDYLCNIAQPTQGVITNISMAHTEFFKSIETIQSTKGELFNYLIQHHGTIFVNTDDSRVAELANDYIDQIQFGFSGQLKDAYRMQGPDEDGCYDLLIGAYQVRMPQAGKAIVLNAAAAGAMALHNGIAPEKIVEALDTYPGEPGRMQKLSLRGVNFYNDAYNANPASVKTGFDSMAAIQSSGRKILIFADMLELGDHSQEQHLEAARQMLEAGFDFIVLLGQEVSIISQYLKEQNYTSFYYNVDKSPAIQRFLHEVAAGDLVYLKGSRSMQLESFISAYKEQK